MTSFAADFLHLFAPFEAVPDVRRLKLCCYLTFRKNVPTLKPFDPYYLTLRTSGDPLFS